MKSSEYDKEIIRLLRRQAKDAASSACRVKGSNKFELWTYKHKCYSEALRLIRSIEPLEAKSLEKKKEIPPFYVIHIKKPIMDFS